MDLKQLADILRRAAIHLVEARIACLEENYPQMLLHARRAVSLRADGESLKTLACAALLNGKFEEARQIWKTLKEDSKENS